MGRRGRAKKARATKTKTEYPGGWREVLARHPLGPKGFALRPRRKMTQSAVEKRAERVWADKQAMEAEGLARIQREP